MIEYTIVYKDKDTGKLHLVKMKAYSGSSVYMKAWNKLQKDYHNKNWFLKAIIFPEDKT